MTSIRSSNMEIEVSEHTWRLYDFYALSPQFEVVRGGGVLRYTAKFGEEQGLPGTQLSAQYIRAVVVGFDSNTQFWRLGLHVSEFPGQQPSWVELTHWDAENASQATPDVQKAGRILAEFIGVPLKLFGVKKAPSEHKTGPLTPHRRRDVSAQSVKAMAQNIRLPLEYPGMWLGAGRQGVILRLDKRFLGDKAGEVAPAYQMCEVDMDKQVVKLLPPTGLLGTFFSTPGRQIPFDEIRNVEYRYSILETSKMQKSGEDELMTEILTRHHIWEVYLTLEGETLLLARTTHVADSELDRRRVQDVAGTKFDTNYGAAVDHYRQYEQDQREMNEAQQWSKAVAMVVASDIGVKLVEIGVSTDLAT